MKFSSPLKLVALLAAALAFTGAQARSADDVKKSGKLIAATEGQFAPFNFFQGKKLTGFEVELAEAAAAKMGLKIEWKTVGFDALLTGLDQDKWDLVIASHGITDDRAKAVAFADPHYCTGGVIVSKGAVKTAADLAGKKVSVQTGTSYLENVQKVANVKEVKNFPQDNDARGALATGRVDAWVTDKFVAKEVLAKNGKGLVIGDFLFVERVAAAVAKNNAPLAAEFNKALAALVSDGSYAKLSQKYFKEDVRCK